MLRNCLYLIWEVEIIVSYKQYLSACFAARRGHLSSVEVEESPHPHPVNVTPPPDPSPDPGAAAWQQGYLATVCRSMLAITPLRLSWLKPQRIEEGESRVIEQRVRQQGKNAQFN